jgi:hypothetical protein
MPRLVFYKNNFALQMPSTEPFKMDILSLALTGGPNGYRINLKDMEVFGASNFTVKSIKLVETLFFLN